MRNVKFQVPNSFLDPFHSMISIRTYYTIIFYHITINDLFLYANRFRFYSLIDYKMMQLEFCYYA